MRDLLQKNYDSIFNAKSDYFDATKQAANSFLIGTIIVIIVFTVIFLIILIFTAFFNKLHCLKFVQKIIMILQLIAGITILLFSMFGIALTVANYYGCYAMDGIITQKDWIQITYKGKLSMSDEAKRAVDECVYEKGEGDFFKVLNIDISVLNQLTSLTQSINTYTQNASFFKT